MSELEKEFKEQLDSFIDKNLAKEVGDRLKERLEDANRMEDDLKKLNEIITTKNKSIEDRDAEIKSLITERNSLKRDLEAFENRESNLIIREETVRDQEIRLEVETLKTQLSCEQEKNIFAQQMVDKVFRNNTVRKTVIEDTRDVRKLEWNHEICQNEDRVIGNSKSTTIEENEGPE